MKLKIFSLVIVILMLTGCSACTDVGTSNSMLQIVSLTGNDLEGTEGSTTVFSDVLTAGGIINDNGVAELTALPIDPMLPDTEITPYMDVMVDQIDVRFERPDGKNVEGVDVPVHFSQPVSMLASIGTTIDVPFVLIRHVAKMEAPLLALRDVPSREFVLQLIAIVTIHGKDMGGHRVAPVTGYISVWCGNFADPEEEEPAA